MKSCSSQPGLSLKRTGFRLSNHLILSPTIMIWKASFKKRGHKKRVASPEVCDLLSGIPHPTSLFTWWVSLKPWYSLYQFGKSVWKLQQSLCVPHCSPDETMIQSVYPTVCRLGESVWKLWYSLCVPHCSPAWNSDTVCVPHCLPAWWVSLEAMIQSLCTPLFASLKLWYSLCTPLFTSLVSQSGNSDTVSVYPIVCWLETMIQSVYPTICWLGESVWKLQQSPGVPL